MKTIVLFDFCGTLINFQTFDPYIKEVILAYYPDKECQLERKSVRLISKVLHHFNGDYSFYKHYLTGLTRGIPEDFFREIARKYYHEKLQPNIISETKNLLKKFVEQGYEVVVLSGGCDLYINEFAAEYQINKVVATKILFRKGKSTGKIASDCLGRMKLKLLKKDLGEKYLEKSHIIGITDSPSDLPMLSICGRKIIISENNHQKWVSSDMEEIIWYKT
ncbi:MAG: HAD-IB family hydrolase [Lachnospiraceae bacterium]|jgi:HAD superfamily hydrolase (TIGR01490 family)|nr:HAD-IB family hydrolase [Lachnospiraceae bacterium]